jgi:hypothetical protein
MQATPRLGIRTTEPTALEAPDLNDIEFDPVLKVSLSCKHLI